jgi:hypothetical protein
MFKHVLRIYDVAKFQEPKCISMIVKVTELILEKLLVVSHKVNQEMLQTLVNRLKECSDSEILINKKAFD